jgi:hypothetical protein
LSFQKYIFEKLKKKLGRENIESSGIFYLLKLKIEN